MIFANNRSHFLDHAPEPDAKTKRLWFIVFSAGLVIGMILLADDNRSVSNPTDTSISQVGPSSTAVADTSASDLMKHGSS